MNKLLLVLVTLSLFTPQLQAQTEWIIREGKNPSYILTTEVTQSSITGWTRKGTLIDYVGESKFNMIKSLSALKYPEIIHFSGPFDLASKTFSGTFNYLFSEKKMAGHLSEDSIWITVGMEGSSEIEVIRGIKKPLGQKKKDYRTIIQQIIQLTETNLYDPKFLQSETWTLFKDVMQSNSEKIADDLELQIGILSIARDFPFTHFSLARNAINQASGNFSLTALNPRTGLLRISSFAGTETQMDSIVEMIDRGKYKNLIIDLRNNGGGDNEIVSPLLAFITDKERIIGVFPNKKWYTENEKPPSPDDYRKLNRFSRGTLTQFYAKAEKGYGLFLLSTPSKKHFAGKVFVITNKSTASTGEIFTLALKENNLATTVGQTTMGAALSGKKFSLDRDISIFIPQNDYISYGGYRIDKKSVKPDVTIKNEDEVQYILKNLIKAD